MSTPAKDISRLNSWKEIAGHLGVTVRTAQLWERERAMPVRRRPGARGGVYAYKSELDAWRCTTPAPARPGRKRLWAGAAAALLLLSAAAAWLVTRAGAPEAFRLKAGALIILDGGGREVWRKEFGRDLLEAAYAIPELGERPARVWIGDLDGDGRREVLFNWLPAEALNTGSQLICYSHRGREKWRYRPGRAMATRRERFDSAYLIENFAVLGKQNLVALTSRHHRHWPNQFVLLDSGGRPRGEYWHSGHLVSLAADDLDGDGKPEIYLGGFNNARRSGALVVLDPERLGGASAEENPDYQLLDLPPARERARVLFPSSCIGRKGHSMVDVWLQSERVVAHLGEHFAGRRGAVLYHFRPDLSLEGLQVASGFAVAHAELHAAGLLDHEFTAAEEREMEIIQFLRPRQP